MPYDLRKNKLKNRFKHSPTVEKGVNITDDAMGGLIDDGKKVRYRDYKTFTDLLAKK